MSKHSPSRQRRREDDKRIHDTMRRTGYADYSPEMNPFEVGTLRRERFERLYPRYLKTWRSRDAWARDLCEVYGGGNLLPRAGSTLLYTDPFACSTCGKITDLKYPAPHFKGTSVGYTTSVLEAEEFCSPLCWEIYKSKQRGPLR